MFHQRLMELRKQHGMTQEQLGAVAGVSRQTVSKWELGETTPELEKLHLLCDYFRISMDELTGREPGGRAEAASEPVSWNWHYEYKSERTLWGVPLIHVNLGRGIHRAKGIVAVGTIAQGWFPLAWRQWGWSPVVRPQWDCSLWGRFRWGYCCLSAPSQWGRWPSER